MPRTCPPCDHGCSQGHDCPSRAADEALNVWINDAERRAAQSAAVAARIAERMFPAPTPERLFPEERMLLIIGAATLVAALLRWL